MHIYIYIYIYIYICIYVTPVVSCAPHVNFERISPMQETVLSEEEFNVIAEYIDSTELSLNRGTSEVLQDRSSPFKV